MTGLFDGIISRLGSTEQRIQALESIKQETQDWIQVHKNYIEKYQRQIDETEYKLERFKENDSNRLKYITVKSIHSDTFDEYIENPGKRVMCNEDDILFTRTGNTGEIITNIKGVFHNNFFLIDFDRKLLSKEYLIYFLRQKRIQEIIMSLAGATTIPDLNHGDFFRLLITIPPDLNEQQKIASVLSNADYSIQKTTEQIEKTKQLKTGLMQKLLTKGISHTNFKKVKLTKNSNVVLSTVPEEWGIINLGNITLPITKGTTPTTEGQDFTKEGIPFFKTENIDERGKVDSENCDYVSNQTHDILRRSQLKENDILFSIAGTLGRVGIIKKNQVPSNTNQALSIIRLKNKKFNLKFLYYILNSKLIKNQVLIQKTILAQPNLSLKQVTNFLIPEPKSESEQQKIASILSNVDSQIESLESKKSQSQKTKRGLMQKLLTGQIRVRV